MGDAAHSFLANNHIEFELALSQQFQIISSHNRSKALNRASFNEEKINPIKEIVLKRSTLC